MARHSINFLLNDALPDPTGNTPQHQISSITELGPTSVWDGRHQELKVGILMRLKLDLQTNVEYYSGANRQTVHNHRTTGCNISPVC